MKLGIDLGSTYSTFATYDSNTGVVSSIGLCEGESASIPSVVAIDQKMGKVCYGANAKDKAGKKRFETYSAFKMLLPENDPDTLREHGYTEKSPAEVTKIFLQSCLEDTLSKYGESKVERLVICAPEIWNDALGTIDGRNVLRELCGQIDGISEVQVVSEPAAASAFCAYNYRKKEGKPFVGKILLIDYGGGTLDITLTEVSAWHDGARDTMEIKVIDRTGAGENSERTIGRAGIAYQEAVLKLAMKESGLFDDLREEELASDGDFKRALNQLEREIKGSAKYIGDMFDLHGASIKRLEKAGEENVFATIEYGMSGDEIEVTCSQLVRVYNEVIAPVLEEQLEKIIESMKEAKIVYDEPNRSDFKVEIVGGFGNYYLVKKQVEDKFEFTDNDLRKTNIVAEYRDQAVALGAALLADGVITIRNTAPYSLGVYCQGLVEYAIRYREEMVYDKIYWHRRRTSAQEEEMQWENELEDPSIQRYLVPGAGITDLLINLGKTDDTAWRVKIKPELSTRLQNIVKSPFKMAAFGFSYSSSGVVSLHVAEYLPIEDRFEPVEKIPLSIFSDMFDVLVPEKVVAE